MTVRTRFAPSPTGYLHIGGVRTALFNWLLARQAGGQFILRIDDTDQQRNLAAALEPILEGFRWLGIDWDEGPEVGGPHAPYAQSQRGDRYAEAVEALLAKGLAYRDFARPEEVQAEREAAEQEKRSFVYSRRWMAESDQQAAAWQAEGRTAVVRLKMPRTGACTFDDLVRGTVSFDWDKEQDHVIQRADGSCLYHLASVVDDQDFQITHVVRAIEHLSNTPRQIFIAQGLGYPLPHYAHLPYVAEPGGTAKLSKRKLDKYLKNREFKRMLDHGQSILERMGRSPRADTFNPVIVDFYRECGYLPEAVVNYILLLGWALDDKTEYFTREEMLKHFCLDRVNKAPASFDPNKLSAMQEHYMRQVAPKKKAALVLPYLQNAGCVAEPPDCEIGPRLVSIVSAAADRIKVAGDILDFGDFFTPDDDLPYDDKAFQKRLVKPAEAAELLQAFAQELAQIETFDADTIEGALQQFVAAREIKIGQIIHAIRVAVTGKAVGMGMFETMAILGREACGRRIERALARVGQAVAENSDGT